MKLGVATLDDAEIRALLTLHQRRMFEASPPGTSFALDLGGLAGAEITLFAARSDTALLGVAALKELDARTGEIKSMRVCDDALGSGVGLALLRHLIETARERGYERLLLETGTGSAFAPANALYLRNGFVRRGTFGGYPETDFNIFYELALEPLSATAAST